MKKKWILLPLVVSIAVVTSCSPSPISDGYLPWETVPTSGNYYLSTGNETISNLDYLGVGTIRVETPQELLSGSSDVIRVTITTYSDLQNNQISQFDRIHIEAVQLKKSGIGSFVTNILVTDTMRVELSGLNFFVEPLFPPQQILFFTPTPVTIQPTLDSILENITPALETPPFEQPPNIDNRNGNENGTSTLSEIPNTEQTPAPISITPDGKAVQWVWNIKSRSRSGEEMLTMSVYLDGNQAPTWVGVIYIDVFIPLTATYTPSPTPTPWYKPLSDNLRDNFSILIMWLCGILWAIVAGFYTVIKKQLNRVDKINEKKEKVRKLRNIIRARTNVKSVKNKSEIEEEILGIEDDIHKLELVKWWHVWKEDRDEKKKKEE